ncbi:MAG: 3'(2'),5'-bisphosphate nucleotidase CysQ [Pseudomonadota bacterium]
MYSDDELKKLVHDVNEIARGAGTIIRRYFNSDFEITIKGDRSPVTSADLAANEFIERKLESLTPEIPRLTEESTMTPYEFRKDWQLLWLVDPLDGTRQFIKNKPDFTVNISLIYLQKPVIGSIYLPIADELYFASRNSGAFTQKQSAQIKAISVKNQIGEMVRICGNRDGHGKSTKHFISHIPNYDFVSRGSSIKSCLIAEGSADIYPRFGPTWEWDTAAAQCILEEAEGFLTDTNMQPLIYNKESLLNPSFLAFGDKNVSWQKFCP